MRNRTILFQGKEIDADDEPGETSDMIHHPDHYTWSRPFRHCGKSCCKIVVSITGVRIAVGSCIPANGTGCMTNSGSGSASATMSEPARRIAARNVKILSERR